MSVKAISGRVRLFRFGPYELDTRQGELRRSGVRLPLQGQPLQILELLLSSPRQLVSREQFREALWPNGTFVDFDDGLNTCIRRLRQALRDDAESPRFIETLPKRGYRFVGNVEKIAEVGNDSTVQAPSQPIEPPTFKRRKMLLPIGVIIAVAAVAWIGIVFHNRRRTATVQIRSIAVLPLENLSGDPGQEYFVDGMTDALITDLAQIRSLKVISRTSAMRYKGTRKPLPEIAKELNVDGIVEGTVIRSGERVRIDAQLIEGNTDRHFWAKTYERNLGDAIALQNEVARAIANEIQVRLTPAEQARLLRIESVDPQAYELYIKGRYFWNKRTEASVQKSIVYFEQAIQREPHYALAYAGMAEAYVNRTDLSPQEKFSRSKAAANTALQMDESIAEAHNALAMSLFCYDWNWTGAEKEFQRALALNPNYAMAHQWYGQYQHAMGVRDWADEVKRAGELDPLSLVTAGGGWALASGQYDLAIEIIRKKLELDPNFAGAYIGLGEAYARKGMYREAIVLLQKAVTLSSRSPQALSALGYTYALLGEKNAALEIVRELLLLSEHRYVSPYYVALIYAGLNEKDEAFAWLQKAVTVRAWELVMLKRAEEQGEMDKLRTDPRYAELKHQIGLPL